MGDEGDCWSRGEMLAIVGQDGRCWLLKVKMEDVGDFWLRWKMLVIVGQDGRCW